MDPSIKQALVDRLRAYLDELDPGDVAPIADEVEAADDEARDLFSVFVEIAGLRNEARAQSRIVKDAVDQFRSVFETLQSSHSALDRELKDAHSRAREQTRTALRPLLIDILDVRDRIAAGLATGLPETAAPWWARWRHSASVPDAWREGLELTLRRLDRVLADRRVTPIASVGRPFAPNFARVVATKDDPSVAEGVVIAESRAGFEWDGELLRAAEVIVSKRAAAGDRSNLGDEK